MTEFTPAPSCADAFEPDALSVSAARERINDLIPDNTGWEKVALRDALDRVLAQDIISPIDVPAHNNSAMDGYAVNGKDLAETPFTLEQVGIAYAGQPYTGAVKSGQCVRIMTGAMMPVNCDTVIMQEHVSAEDNNITVHRPYETGVNVRMAGEDLANGSAVLPTGHQIRPADLGLIASLGMGEVVVKRKLTVAFFSTGDELRSIGEPLEEGQIYDSNRYTLFGMLTRLGVNVIDMGVVPDQKQALREALQQASMQADVIITSGGVSVGDADYVKEMLTELGQVNFWKISMKPGRPLAFGKINDALFFGLPGNPVSVMVTFYQFVLPALRHFSGSSAQLDPLLTATATSSIRKRTGRFEFQRGILSTNEDGQLEVCTTGSQGSGILRSMSVANCFILLEEQCDGVQAGDTVTVQSFSGLI
jgi:molybdopterin molybdotransferase